MSATENEIRELIDNGMPPELAPPAADALAKLIMTGGDVAILYHSDKDVARYFFMQGFVAGNMVSIHQN